MTELYILGLIAWLCLGIGLILLKPTFRWLVKHRWAVDDDTHST